MNSIKLNIETTKNLLAFSGGIDSTALFFLMIKEDIPFDIAIVNYNQRSQSKDETIYATQLAHKYNKKCFTTIYEDDKKFSEKSARDFRHNFFDEIIKKEKYESLITAHQLNDKCEWFLMQFTKGAGVSELSGMQEISYKNGYKVLKPLLAYTKQQLQDYLDLNNIKYFIDETNKDQKYKRNYFRHNFSDRLLEEFSSGISRSFEYLQKDVDSLFSDISMQTFDELNIYTFKGDINIAIRVIDKDLKQRGFIISHDTREEIIDKKEVVVSHKIAVTINDTKIWIAPVCSNKMDKKFKEKCRINKIPTNIRAYLSTIDEFTFEV